MRLDRSKNLTLQNVVSSRLILNYDLFIFLCIGVLSCLTLFLVAYMIPARTLGDGLESSSSPSAITASNMVGCSSRSGVSSWWMVWWMAGYRCDQPILGRWSHCAVPPGFNLPRHLWTKLNHFRTGQGKCAANVARWRKIPDPSCSCGVAKQTLSHIVNDCPLSRFPVGPTTLHLAGDEAIKWLGMQCKR